MGKIPKGELTLNEIKVKVPRSTASNTCGAEVVGFLACLDHHNNNEQECMQTKTALFNCMQAAANAGMTQRRHKAPINHESECYAPTLPSPEALKNKIILKVCTQPPCACSWRCTDHAHAHGDVLTMCILTSLVVAALPLLTHLALPSSRRSRTRRYG